MIIKINKVELLEEVNKRTYPNLSPEQRRATAKQIRNFRNQARDQWKQGNIEKYKQNFIDSKLTARMNDGQARLKNLDKNGLEIKDDVNYSDGMRNKISNAIHKHNGNPTMGNTTNYILSHVLAGGLDLNSYGAKNTLIDKPLSQIKGAIPKHDPKLNKVNYIRDANGDTKLAVGTAGLIGAAGYGIHKLGDSIEKNGIYKDDTPAPAPAPAIKVQEPINNHYKQPEVQPKQPEVQPKQPDDDNDELSGTELLGLGIGAAGLGIAGHHIYKKFKK